MTAKNEEFPGVSYCGASHIKNIVEYGVLWII
jgi:hypothetical protein